MTFYILAVFAAICALAVIIAMKKSGHFFKSLIISAVQGTAALLAVNASGVMTGVTVPVNALSISSGVIFGIPGTIFHIIAKVIIR